MYIIKKIRNRFFLNESEKKFISFGESLKKIKSKNSILIEAPLDDNFFLIKNLIIGKYLSYKYNCKLVYYINFNRIRSFSSFFNKFYYKLAYNFFSFLKIRKLYNSFCDKMVLNCFYPKNISFNNKFFFKSNLFHRVLNFRYKGGLIGDLVIDSYLYYFYNFLYTSKINNCVYEDNFKKHFIESLKIAESFFHVYKNNNIKYLINNYSSYLEHGLAARFAEKKRIPIFYLSENDRPFIKSKSSKHKREFKYYKKIFNKLKSKQKKINYCLNILKKRVNGNIDYSIKYLKNSYYKNTNNQILYNSKKSICLFAHSTADSLFGFESALFLQQKSWFEFTLNFLETHSKQLNIFLKIHPNESIDGINYIKKIVCDRYKFVHILDKTVNINTLINNNLVAGLTLHGSIGLELAYNYIPTIYANKNPYVAFEFCKNPKTLNQYKLMLGNLNNFKKKNEYRIESAIFYYMNYIFPGFGKINEKKDDIINLIKFDKLNVHLTKNELNKYLCYLNKDKICKIFKKLEKSEETFDNFNISSV